MAHIQDDGTVSPSFLNMRSIGRAQNTALQSNLALRMGDVKRIVYPGEPGNEKGSFIQYVVNVQQTDDRGPVANFEYRGCMVGNLFGGTADVLRYTLRDGDGKDVADNGIGVGSKVLMLCVNGHQTQAVIIGGLRPDKETKDSKEDGHNLYFEFNGTTFAIDKDGQVKFQVKGATDGNGEVTKEVKSSPTVEVKSDGRVYITSEGVYIGEATDKMLLADTYRNAENKMNKDLITQFGQLATQFSQLAAAFTSAAAALAVPISGGPASAPAFTAAAAASTAAASVITTGIVPKISEFEGQANTYLSEKNKND